MVRWKAKQATRKSACVGGRRSGWVGIKACLGKARCKHYGWAGIKACLGIARYKTPWLAVAKQANSQVCLLWYNTPNAVIRWKAKQATRKSACVGIAQCQRLWLGGEKITYGWAGDLVDAQVGWESKPALVKHDARRYGWAGAKQANSQVCLLWYNATQTLWFGGKQSRQLASLPA